MEEFTAKVKVHQEKWFPSTQPLKGVEDLFKTLKPTKGDVGIGGVRLALATSSARRTFLLKTTHLPDMISNFEERHIVLGDDPRIGAGRGKPAPDIYLLALKSINDDLPADQHIHPEECLVFEDSVPGVEAGRRAGMQVAWIPHQGLLEVYQDRQKEVLAGMTGEHPEDESEEGKRQDQKWQSHREQWVAEGREFARVRGRTGEIDDGWGKLYSSLEAFPLELYGISE